jgi:hypothetical protein
MNPLYQLLAIVIMAAIMPAADRPPDFADFKVAAEFHGPPAEPIFATAEQKRYRTRIRRGVREGAWIGNGDSATRTTGPNFAGHLYVIRWGCGSDCLMMAVVDAENGKIYGSPLRGRDTELFVNMDIMSDRNIDIRPDSSLMILRNACRIERRECGVYYFNWTASGFRLITRTLIDLTRQQ